MKEKAWTGYADNRYAAQREAGFRWLRFGADVEREYRAGAATRKARRIRIAVTLVLLAGLGLDVFDAMGGRVGPSPWLFVAGALVAAMLYVLEHRARMEFLLRNELRQQAVLDTLTGLMNRRAFTAHLDSAWLQAQRALTSIGLLLLDVDDFKRINATCGHTFGDSALQHVAHVLRRSALRPLDAAARYGDDEFIAIWFDVDGAWLAKLAQEMPARLGSLDCGDAAAAVPMTVSGGMVLAWPRPGIAVDDAIRGADELLSETRRSNPGTVGYRVLRPAAPAQERTAA